jgi:hypothetical protein
MKKKIYKSVIQVEILADRPMGDDFIENLSLVDYEITQGECSGVVKVISSNEILEGEDAVKECHKQGSSPDFFMMDEEGNEI